MYSPDFMRFLINYQKPENKENSTKVFRFGLKKGKLAAILLPVKY